ncbi:MAG TPA: GNAT family N-acetyltransferase [Bacteroidia bacterium]|jgi:hypothetical protein|nr:GNAT family N-acetyltransferase [Bacteroidia bacterium]
MPDNKEIYRQLEPKCLPIFHKPFFLNSVVKDNWDVIPIVVENKIVACLPYTIQQIKGYKNFTQPPMAQFLGPWIDAGYLIKDKVRKQKKIMNELYDRLPACSSYLQNWSPDIDNWLPLYWKGYSQTTKYTNVISDLTDLNTVWEHFDSDVKRRIRKSEEKFKVQPHEDFEVFFNVLEDSFNRKGAKNPLKCEIFSSMDGACSQNLCRKMLVAKDTAGNIAGGIYLIWDSRSVYYMAGGFTAGNSDVMCLLIWEGIKLAASMKLQFDFEGSMIESIEHFFRSFGPVQKPYFTVSKINSRKIKIIDNIKSIQKAILNK